MLKKLVVATSLVAVASVASAGITASVVPYYEGLLSEAGSETTYVYSFDLQVTVTGDDAWTVAGGLVVGAPWITATDATFYQHAANDTNPPNPAFFAYFPDSEYTSFYTTHLGYPATPTVPGVSPGFAYGPVDLATSLNADWFWTPDGNFYPGTFTIARFTGIIDEGVDRATLDIDMLVGSLDVSPFVFQWTGVIPEPASLSLLALGGLALIRRR